MRITTAFVLCLFAGAAFAAELPELATDDYNAARVALVAEGWKPHRMADSDCVNREETEWCVLYPEIRFCGSGLAPCQMVWSRNGEFLTVYTLGERHPKVTGTVDGLQP